MGVKEVNKAEEEFKKTHNQLEDLLTEDELNSYREIDFPDNVIILNRALKEKIKTEPEYEVWVPIRYYSYSVSVIDKSYYVFYTRYAWISNRGHVEHLRKKTKSTTGFGKNYKMSLVRTETTVDRFTVHRAVAISFVPRPEELKDTPYHLLQVDHLDSIKRNNWFNNLEWVTGGTNVQRAVNNSLRVYKKGEEHYATKPYLAEVIIPGEFEGFKFIRSGKTEVETLLGTGYSSSVNATAQGKLQQSKGCKWSYATPEEIIEYGNVVVPSELISLLRGYNSNWKDPILATRISDSHLILITEGPKQMKALGFGNQGVYNCVNGREESYRGFKFKRVTEEEIPEIQKLIDTQTTTFTPLEQIKLFVILGTRLSDNHMVLYQGAKALIKDGWDKSVIYKTVKKPGKVFKGWTFVKLESEEEIEKYKELIDKQSTVF